MSITLDGTNGITSPDFEPSSSTTPTNGLFLPTTNTLGFATNSTERLRLDASGNLGLGVTPSAWGTTGTVLKPIQIGQSAAFVGYAAVNGAIVSENAYYNAGWKYIGTGSASQYFTGSGAHQWFTAPSGTAGAAISFTQAMTLDASGNLGIGTTSPTAIGSSRVVEIGATAGNSSFQLFSVAGAIKGSIYANATETSLGSVAAIPLLFKTSDTERARIDSSGNLLVGTTSPLLAGTHSFVNTGATACSLTVRNTNASAGGYWRLGPDSTNNFVVYNQNNVGMYMATGATSWTANSDERLKTDLKPIENAAQKVSTLRAVTGRYKTDDEGVSRSFLIAQDVQAVLPEAVDASDPDKLGVQYTDTIPLLVAAIQELTARLEALENK